MRFLVVNIDCMDRICHTPFALPNSYHKHSPFLLTEYYSETLASHLDLEASSEGTKLTGVTRVLSRLSRLDMVHHFQVLPVHPS